MVLLFEVFSARYAAYALGLVLTLVLLVVSFLFGCELDLLASMVSLTYGSVFILLALLLVQFSPLSSYGQRGALQSPNFFWVFIFTVFFFFCFSGASSSVFVVWATSILWQDLTSQVGLEFYQLGLLAHELFFRFFVFETVWANIFLALALIVYALLLKSRAYFSLPQTLRAALGVVRAAHWRRRWASFQVRAVHHPRRQVRRLVNSTPRHRV
jgi:hypothetical protein